MMISAIVAPPTGTAITDTFNRANSTTINPASDGGTWTIDTGQVNIAGNHAVPTSPAGSFLGQVAFIRRDFGSWAVDVTIIHWRFGSDGGDRLWVAYDPATQSGYYLAFDATTSCSLIRYASGVGTAIGTSITGLTSWASGASSTTLRLVYNGLGSFDVYQGGTLKGSRTTTDPLLTGTWVAYSSNRINTGELDNFSAVNV